MEGITFFGEMSAVAVGGIIILIVSLIVSSLFGQIMRIDGVVCEQAMVPVL